MNELTESYLENVKTVDEILRINDNFDMIKKIHHVGSDEITLYYLDGFVDGGAINKLLTYFCSLKNPDPAENSESRTAQFFLEHSFPFVEATLSEDLNEMIRNVLAGTTLCLGTSFGRFGIIIDSRKYPARTVGEPENDRVMIGARDGFVETLIFNIALIRRRIRDPKLTVNYFNVGDESHTDVGLVYMDGKADGKYVNKLKDKLRSLHTDSLMMGHESLAELLITEKWYNPFPKIRYTERPDVAAAQILEGSVVILVDNSPEGMILPSTLFDFLQETNDYYFPPLTGTYIRFVRHLVFWATLLFVPIWFLLTEVPEYVPPSMAFLLPKETGSIPIFLQLILVEFLVDGLRMASMNTPDMLSNSLSVIGGLILGDFAVDIGWLIPEVLVYTSFVAIANFTQRSYELGYAFKFMRISLIILVKLFRLPGLILGLIGIVVLLFTNATVIQGHSYLYPLFPFRWKALKTFIVRMKKS